MERIYLGNDHVVTLAGLADSEGVPLVAATVAATILVRDTMLELPGETWPLTMNRQPNDDYSCTVDKAVQLVKGEFYVLRITATEGGIDAQWDISLVGTWRK